MKPLRALSGIALTLLAGATLSACGRDDSDPASGGLTVGESDRLEAAAERLDQRTPSPARDDSVALEGQIRDRLETENPANSAR